MSLDAQHDPLASELYDIAAQPSAESDLSTRRTPPFGGVPQRRRSAGDRISTRGSTVRRRAVAEPCDAVVVIAEPATTDIVCQSGTDSTPTRTVSKIGDVDREREIDRRLAELGLTEYKRRHEQSIAELLDAQITAKDGLVAVLKRCRRRQRDPSSEEAGGGGGCGGRPVDEIRNIVQQKIIRDAWGDKIAYEIRLFMGCFTKNVTYQTTGNVVDVQGNTSADDSIGGGNVKLTKDITVELPQSADPTRVTVSYVGGVVKIHAPIVQPWRHTATTSRTSAAGVDNTNDKRFQRPQFSSISPIYSLHMKLMAGGN